MEMKVLRGGLLTTVQDLGRPGLRAIGVPAGGAMDALALRLANLLVGNPETAAGLEITQTGPVLEFSADALVAVIAPRMESAEVGKPIRVQRGKRWSPGRVLGGCRAWLAIAGGLEVPVVLGGKGTDLRAGWGGWQGRALAAGDLVPVGQSRHCPDSEHWWLDARWLPEMEKPAVLRVVPGAQADEFAPDWHEAEFGVSPQSDRMGIRLQGQPLRRRVPDDLPSSAVAPGTVQVPPAGLPILLGADAQTIGGYPQLAHVITVDLPKLAQLAPGDRVRFAPVTLAEAQRRRHERQHWLGILRQGLAVKFR